MFAHSNLFAVNVSLCTYDIFWIYQYQWHFDIWLHLSPGRNPVKSAQKALIINESTFAFSFNVIIALCRVFISLLLYILVENIVLSASSSSLMAHHLSWHHWHQKQEQNIEVQTKTTSRELVHLLQPDNNVGRASPLKSLRWYQMPTLVMMHALRRWQLPPVPIVHYAVSLCGLLSVIEYHLERSLERVFSRAYFLESIQSIIEGRISYQSWA